LNDYRSCGVLGCDRIATACGYRCSIVSTGAYLDRRPGLLTLLFSSTEASLGCPLMPGFCSKRRFANEDSRKSEPQPLEVADE